MLNYLHTYLCGCTPTLRSILGIGSDKTGAIILYLDDGFESVP
jgi:hypothetical protein